MSYSDNSIPGIAQGAGAGSPGDRFQSDVAKSAQQASDEAVQFQLWVANQATSLAKLKVFHAMAKQINDQQ